MSKDKGGARTSLHARFRRSKEWLSFRKEMLEKHPFCAFCGSKRATRTVHHVYLCETEEEYENLDESRFIVLCSQCHSYLHWIGRKKSSTPAVNAAKKSAEMAGFGGDWIKYYP